MGITISFIILGTILLWFLIEADGKWLPKVFAILITLMFSLNVARSFDNLSGWASSDNLPEKFLIHWVLVKEPSKAEGDSGGIYIWVSSLEEESFSRLEFFVNNNPTDPRAYKVEYSIEMHMLAETLNKEISGGKRIIGMGEGLRSDMNTPEKLLESLIDGGRRELGSTEQSDSNGIYFYEVPAAERLTK